MKRQASLRKERRRGTPRQYKGPFRRWDDPVGRGRGAARVRQSGGAALTGPRAWLGQHRLALRGALSRMRQAPMATFFTLAVIGIALALPAGLSALIDNAQRASASWNSTAQISVFLKLDVPEKQALTMAERLRELTAVHRVDYISPQQALEEFRQLSQFDGVLEALGNNPLPAVLVVEPALNRGQADKIEALRARLQALPEVDTAQLDMAWLQRLYAIMALAEKIVVFLSTVLILAVLVIVGNTIRLLSHQYREEIKISQLLGATEAFIRRPFLYSGAFYGLAGGAVAWTVVAVTLWWLNGSVLELTRLYQSEFGLHGLGFSQGLLLLATGTLLGLMGSWVAVSRYIRAMRPR